MEKRLLNILKYVGIIGAAICSVAYIVVVLVLIQGFKAENTTQTLSFALVNAVVGFIILTFLKIQGESFAKSLPENKAISEAYYAAQTRDKKYHSMKYFWITSTIKDILTKVFGVFMSTFGIIYIVIIGSNDWNLLLLAFVNLLLFISFGLLGLEKSYEFYNTRMVPYMQHQLEMRFNAQNRANSRVLDTAANNNDGVDENANIRANFKSNDEGEDNGNI